MSKNWTDLWNLPKSSWYFFFSLFGNDWQYFLQSLASSYWAFVRKWRAGFENTMPPTKH